MGDCRLAPAGSNYTFFATLSNGGGLLCQAVYKPCKGEAPLWDFPDGTLYLREYAAYLLSEALGWGLVPYTVIRGGPHGIGSVQQYVEADPRLHYFTLREGPEHHEDLLRICAFDVLTNNADRKAGHCLLDKDGRIWAIDHGITFHDEPKLRTVIWDFAGEPIPEGILADMQRLVEAYDQPGRLLGQLAPLLSPRELIAFQRRAEDLLAHPEFPFPTRRRAVPWPPF